MSRIGFVTSILILSLATSALAQTFPEDRQNPKEYTQEDSHPLKLVSYALAPIGFVLEWTVARPLHYLATESALAPMYGNEDSAMRDTPPPMAQIPAPLYSEVQPPPTEPAVRQPIGPPFAPKRPATSAAPQPQASSPPPATSPDIGQPTLQH